MVLVIHAVLLLRCDVLWALFWGEAVNFVCYVGFALVLAKSLLCRGVCWRFDCFVGLLTVLYLCIMDCVIV